MMGGGLGVSVMLKRVWVFSPFIIFLEKILNFTVLLFSIFGFGLEGSILRGDLLAAVV